MDDTQQSRTTDAAATRKRRSSILKSQRPARTPFSELEFNVATPTDTAKSRRVSFSRRTGVAEFVTNEATTTWKDFYEQHNKSLESSGNDSEVNPSRQPVEHLGRRIFDQQFEEVEAVDFIGSANPTTSNGSFNNINFADQIASLDCASDAKLTAPHNKFELSAFTDQQSKLFGNDFTVTGLGEMSGKINFNFSNIQQIGEKDDLDEIQRDLERVSCNAVCPGPADRHNISEYIEVDLNMTLVAKNDDCDMSIKDTIASPKVQDISRSSSIDKINKLDKDWMTDKENIVINPYISPVETDNFAVNDEPDQVLVFDGKRLTLQTERSNNDMRKTLLPNSSSDTPQRKTIVLNTNDDLPNFVDDASLRCDRDLKASTSYRDPNICVKAVHKVEIVKRGITDTIPVTQSLPMCGAPQNYKGMEEIETGNISITQSLAGQIIPGKSTDRRRTIVYENDTGNISITQALPTNILQNDVKKRKTIVFDDDKGNISITQAVTSQLIVDNAAAGRRKTILYEDDQADVSITQALPARVILDQKDQEKRKTIVFDDDSGNISITQALPANIVLESRQDKRKTILYEQDTGNLSVTQAAPTNLILTGNPSGTERRRTILYEDDAGNISVTQAIPQNIILGKIDIKEDTQILDANISMTQALPTNIILKDNDNRRRTIVYDNDTGNISITQAVPSQLLAGLTNKECGTAPDDDTSKTSAPKETNNRRRTIIYDEDAADVSMTQAIPTNIIIPNQENENNCKENSNIPNTDSSNISLPKKVPANVFLLKGLTSESDESIPVTKASEEDLEEDIIKEVSMNIDNAMQTKKTPTVIFANEDESDEESYRETINQNATEIKDSVVPTEVRKSVVFICEDTNSEDISIKKSVHRKSVVFTDNNGVHDETNEKNKESKDNVRTEKKRTVVFAIETDDNEMSETQAATKIQSILHDATILEDLDKSKGGICKTKPIPDQIMDINADMLKKSIEKDCNLSVQTSFCKITTDVIVYSTTALETGPEVELNSGAPSVCESNITVTSKTEKDELVKPIPSTHIIVPTPIDSNEIIKSSNVPSPVKSIEIIKSSIDEPESKENVGRVIESKLEVFDIKMDDLVEAEKVTEILPETESEVKGSNDVVPAESKTSVLYTLLDMTDPPHSDLYDKRAETEIATSPIESEPHLDQDLDLEKDISMVSCVTAKDQAIQTDQVDSDKDDESKDNDSDIIQLVRDSPMSISIKPQEESLENTLAQLIHKGDQMRTLSPDTSNTDEKEAEKVRLKSFKDASDTKELLDMICDFTDNSRCSSKMESISAVPEQVELPVKALDVKEPLAIENKMDVQEPRRLSFATKRQSIIISRENLLSNISMAQAVLQKSRVEFDDTSLTDDNQDSSPEDLENLQTSNRMSKEVVKTLQFDDESLSENSLKSDLNKSWSLKKPPLGETSYAKDKTHVIPSYLKDVSDGIKQLMSDLVKPMSDGIPFEGQEERVRRSMSTVSTQIQANLTTSSQIDVNTELSSVPSSRENMENVPCYRSGNGILKVPGSPDLSSEQEVQSEGSKTPEPNCRLVSNEEPVLVFDHENPLNNILLRPLDYMHAHNYEPLKIPIPIENLDKKSDETLCGSDKSRSCQINMELDSSSVDLNVIEARDVEVNTEELVSQQYIVTVSGGMDKRPVHKLGSVDRAVNVQSEVETTAVNTVIAMKPNKELLDTSSSLTLMDTISESESKISSSHRSPKKERKTPVKSVKTKLKSMSAESDITSTDDSVSYMLSKGKKRNHIPVTPNRRASVEVTPKPNSKMQKISNSPNTNRILLRMSHQPTKLLAERDTDSYDSSVQEINSQELAEKKPHNYENNITIQQLIAEYQIDAGLNKEILDVLQDTDFYKSGSVTTEAPSRSISATSESLDKISSFTSSKNLGSNKDMHSVAITASSQSTVCSRIDWHPELNSLSSNKNVSYFDSGVNIVSKIDMLPFMGSYECERESSLGDTWSFLLLHGRIRLSIRLAHRHDNATRTRVRADTPVTDISVDTVEYDKKNPVAILCIRFACETMRYMVSSFSETKYQARDVPLLLRRCAAVARVALRWGRAMHDAKLHLAYTLDSDGHLTLKVANIPLRSVWEVSMDLELVVEHPSKSPWPRAGNVRVNRVVSDVPVSDEDVRKALRNTPNDWGHAPKTLWRIFRYLKHKQREDYDMLLAV